MIKLVLNGAEAKAIKAELSGREDSPIRRLDFEAAEWAFAGDTIELFYGEKRYFIGKVIYADNSAREGVCTGYALDAGVYLARNRMYMSVTATPEEIARRVCAELKITQYRLAMRSGKLSVLSTGNLSAYEILKKAYPDERIFFENGVLIIRKPILRGEVGEVIERRRVQSARDMINRVLVLKKKRLQKAVENEGDIVRFGIFTGAYTVPLSAVSEPKTALKGMSDELIVLAEGNIELESGDTAAFLGNEYTVLEDRHVFDGEYTCTLTLKV